MSIRGHIFNIQSFSLQDGPGVRTTVFFSGCNLRCAWCHNPESRQTKALRYHSDQCIGCGACFSLCPQNAHITAGDRHILDRSRCMICGRCADSCYAGALELVGREITADSLINTLLADKPYFGNSGGGVTFSGGECMLQPDFLGEMLRLCRENGIHTAIDTAGHVPYESFLRILPYSDLFLYDIKAIDSALHMELTGVDGVLIRENLKRLVAGGADVIVRVPCVAGANLDEIPAIARWMRGLPVVAVELLPYHKLGEGKFALLGQEAERFTAPSNGEMERLARLFREEGRTVRYTQQ